MFLFTFQRIECILSLRLQGILFLWISMIFDKCCGCVQAVDPGPGVLDCSSMFMLTRCCQAPLHCYLFDSITTSTYCTVYGCIWYQYQQRFCFCLNWMLYLAYNLSFFFNRLNKFLEGPVSDAAPGRLPCMLCLGHGAGHDGRLDITRHHSTSLDQKVLFYPFPAVTGRLVSFETWNGLRVYCMKLKAASDERTVFGISLRQVAMKPE